MSLYQSQIKLSGSLQSMWKLQQHCWCRCVLMHESFPLNRKTELSDTSAVLEAFKFIENAAAEFSDEDEEEDSEGKDRTNVESRTVRNRATLPCLVCSHLVAEVAAVLLIMTRDDFPADHKEEAPVGSAAGQYGHHRGPRHRGGAEGLWLPVQSWRDGHLTGD